MKSNKFIGHFMAFFTMVVWGTTVISSTKLLEGGLSSAEIVTCRFLIAFVILNILYPPRLKFESVKRELTYAVAGLFGVTLYFFLEITALTYTKAAICSIILATAPMFTGLISLIMSKSDKPKFNFFVGFVMAIAGIALVTFEDGFSFDFSSKSGIIGALFALGAAFVWGIYSLLTKEIGSYGHNVIQTTRRVFMYGLIFMIPTVFFFDVDWHHYTMLADKTMLFNLLYLGICASGICFLTWGGAINSIGPVKATTYIYGVPLVTLVFSYFFLKEQTLTWQMFLGAALIIFGLIVSVAKSTNEHHGAKKKRKS